MSLITAVALLPAILFYNTFTLMRPSVTAVQPSVAISSVKPQSVSVAVLPEVAPTLPAAAATFQPPAAAPVAASVASDVVKRPLLPFEPDSAPSEVPQAAVVPLPALTTARIIIPALNVDQVITRVLVKDGSWDISTLENQIGHLQTTGEQPGDGLAMTFVGHTTLPWPGTGPFADLILLEHGEEIIYRWNGTDYIYEVTRILSVDPTHVSALYEEDGDMLMLATCSGWNFLQGGYDERLVTRAELVRQQPAPTPLSNSGLH